MTFKFSSLDFHFHSYPKNKTTLHFQNIVSTILHPFSSTQPHLYWWFQKYSCSCWRVIYIYTVELRALLLALKRIQSLISTQCLILMIFFLQETSNSSRHSYLSRFPHLYHTFSLNYSIRLVWIPCHVGISENCCHSRQKKFLISFVWFIHCNCLQTICNRTFHGNMKGPIFKPTKSNIQRPTSYNFSHKDSVVYTCLHIGHTCLAHSFLLIRLPSPMCLFCKVQLSIRHILSEGPQYHP